MTDEEAELLIGYWERCVDRFEGAALLLRHGHFDQSANSSFYAAFYAVSALLMTVGLDLKKHSAVRAAFHKNFIKSGDLSSEVGRFYKFLENVRRVGDYGQLKHVNKAEAESAFDQARRLIEATRDYLDAKGIQYK